MPGHEIELKFLVADGGLDAALAAAPAGDDEVRTLRSIYFDTPDGALAAAGLSLRLRHDGRRIVQTVKRGKGMSREEHEAEVQALDPSWPVLAEALGAVMVEPVSEVRISRRQRLVRYAGAEIEIAADVGEVEAGGRTEAFTELELELKSGPEAALHALVVELSKSVALTPSSVSKSDRGRNLRNI